MALLSVVSVADRAGFHIFAAALRTSRHSGALEHPGAFTVFAPTDSAFEKLPAPTLERLLHRDAELLHTVLGYHLAAGRVETARFADKRIRAVMQSGGDVLIEGRNVLKVNGANVIKRDLRADNGVVHGIDSVLWPPETGRVLGAA